MFIDENVQVTISMREILDNMSDSKVARLALDALSELEHRFAKLAPAKDYSAPNAVANLRASLVDLNERYLPK